MKTTTRERRNRPPSLLVLALSCYSLAAGCGSGRGDKQKHGKGVRSDRIREIPELAGTARLWISANGRWLAGQLDGGAIEDANGSYRLVDRESESLVRQEPGVVVAPPDNDGAVTVVTGTPPELVFPAGSRILIPNRPGGTLDRVLVGGSGPTLIATYRVIPDGKSMATDHWIVRFDAEGNVLWEVDIPSTNGVALSADGRELVVGSGVPAGEDVFEGLSFVDTTNGTVRERRGLASWNGSGILFVSPGHHNVYFVGWPGLLALIRSEKKLMKFSPWMGNVKELIPCGSKLLALSQQELGGDSFAMLGSTATGTNVSIREINPASAETALLDERHLDSQDIEAAITCDGETILLAIGASGAGAGR